MVESMNQSLATLSELAVNISNSKEKARKLLLLEEDGDNLTKELKELVRKWSAQT